MFGAYEEKINDLTNYYVNCSDANNFPGLIKNFELFFDFFKFYSFIIDFVDLIFKINGKDFALNSTEYIIKVFVESLLFLFKTRISKNYYK